MSRLATRSASPTNTHTHTQASGCCVCGMEGRTARAVLLRSRPHSSPKEERRTTTFSNETDETAANRCAAYSHSEQKVLTTILIDASTYKYTIIYTHTHTLYRQRRIYLYQEKLPGRRDSQDDESNRWPYDVLRSAGNKYIHILLKGEIFTKLNNFLFPCGLKRWRRTVETKHICFQSSSLIVCYVSTLKYRGVYMSCPLDLFADSPCCL